MIPKIFHSGGSGDSDVLGEYGNSGDSKDFYDSGESSGSIESDNSGEFGDSGEFLMLVVPESPVILVDLVILVHPVILVNLEKYRRCP